tara:strand:- start:3818 stop:4171 length:354 start_codon:yes stop_codon:yes gene_type:complete
MDSTPLNFQALKTRLRQEGIRFRSHTYGIWICDDRRNKIASVSDNDGRFFVSGFSGGCFAGTGGPFQCVGDVDTIDEVIEGVKRTIGAEVLENDRLTTFEGTPRAPGFKIPEPPADL